MYIRKMPKYAFPQALRDIAAGLEEHGSPFVTAEAGAHGPDESSASTLSAEQVEALGEALESMPAPGAVPDPEAADESRGEESAMDSTARTLPWGKQALRSYGMEFIEGLIWIENMIGLRADKQLPCMKFESNIDIRARNPHSSASGLIQFMAFTAKNLGTTIEQIRQMDAMTQLSYVYRYFKDFHDRGHDLSQWDTADTYMAILWPSGIGKPLDHPIFVEGKGRTYAVNRGLDANKDGMVTKREAANRIIRLEAEGYLPENVLVV